MSQHMDALQVANQRRAARAATRARITTAGGTGHERRTPPARANGQRAAADELQLRPDCLNTMALFDFLRWSCRTPLARAVMRAAGVTSELRTCGELTDRQVEIVCSVLRQPAEWYVSEAA